MKLTYAQYSAPRFAEQFMESKNKSEILELVLADGVEVEMPTARALLHTILWTPLFNYNIVPRVYEVVLFDNLNSKVLTEAHNIVYYRLLEIIQRVTEWDHMPLLEQIWMSIDAVDNFIVTHCNAYMNSMSSLSLCRLMQEPKLKEVLDVVIDPKAGTWIAEAQIKHSTTQMQKVLHDRHGLKNNVLINFIETDSLKANSLAQSLMMYGPRSDIDDTVSRHIIRASAISGLRSIEDYAIESYGAKKSQFLKTEAIRRSQYSARRLRLACSALRKVYPGSCGNQLTIPHTIHHAHMMNYIDKVIIEDGKRIVLNRHNIRKYADTTVQMVSPFGCKHHDGVCEACAGRGNMNLIAFLPPKIHIGIMAATFLGGRVSQLILSNKHLISTMSKIYNLPDLASQYFYKVEDKLFWNRDMFGTHKNLSIRIPIEALGPLTDLNHDMLPDCESFSDIPYFELLNEDRVLDTVQMAVDEFVPYLSEFALQYMQDNFNKMIIDEENDTITIPLNKFSPEHEFMKYLVINDDMVAFTENVKFFLNNTISKFTSASQALQSFTELLYSKTSMNISYIEMVLRAFSTGSIEAPFIPTVTDTEHVMFGTMDIIARSAISTKMSYERLPEFFNKASSSVIELHPSIFDKLYGFK